MTTITGETGAGKSILLDALSLTLGDRADFSRIRSGADRAEVSAQFDIADSQAAKDWLIEQQLDSDNDCLLRRTIGNGKSSAWINGHLVTLNQMRELAEMLINIHSQHEHQALTKSQYHRQLLDQFAKHPDLLKSVAEAYQSWHEASLQVAHLRSQLDEGRERLELLSFQVEELTALNIAEDEFSQLEQEQKQLANAENILSILGQLISLLEEQEDANLESLLQHSLSLTDQLPVQTSRLAEAREMLQSAAIQVEEATATIRREADNIELDPERLALVEERLSQIFQLSRKYRTTPEELRHLTQSLEAELAQLQNPEAALQDAEQKEKQLLEDFLQLSEQLSNSRKEAASHLAKEVNGHFDSLSMKGAEIIFNLEFKPDEIRNDWGADQIELLVRTNPGQPYGAISKIASGGELSRISLAIQVVTAQGGQTPTLVFDEVDVGIGGATADTVGALLRDLGGRAQIICITHLAQVASKGHQQLRVSKRTSTDSAQTQIQRLTASDRVEEIARMLGGAKISEKSRDNARELLGEPHV